MLAARSSRGQVQQELLSIGKALFSGRGCCLDVASSPCPLYPSCLPIAYFQKMRAFPATNDEIDPTAGQSLPARCSSRFPVRIMGAQPGIKTALGVRPPFSLPQHPAAPSLEQSPTAAVWQHTRLLPSSLAEQDGIGRMEDGMEVVCGGCRMVLKPRIFLARSPILSPPLLFIPNHPSVHPQIQNGISHFWLTVLIATALPCFVHLLF